MKRKHYYIFTLSILFLFFACDNDDSQTQENESQANLIIKIKFDPTQERLDNFGQPANIPSGNAAQSPFINKMSANYIEFAPNGNTPLGSGEILYNGQETTEGGGAAIDFQNAQFAGNNEAFISIPINTINPGTYEWVRVSLAYQEGDISFLRNNNQLTATLASFVGFNNYITNLDLNGSNFEINENKLQGFWAVESQGFMVTGQAPEGATTVPNPISNTSSIPQGSCVVTGNFESQFTITGTENEDVTLVFSFSTNNSFEWTEINQDGLYEPSIGENVVDMGLRGLIPFIEQE